MGGLTRANRRREDGLDLRNTCQPFVPPFEGDFGLFLYIFAVRSVSGDSAQRREGVISYDNGKQTRLQRAVRCAGSHELFLSKSRACTKADAPGGEALFWSMAPHGFAPYLCEATTHAVRLWRHEC